jgi:hypothetical protein
VRALLKRRVAAVVPEAHGYPPRVLSFESIDEPDHAISRINDGRWPDRARADPVCTGASRSHDAAALALSYFDPHVDFTGRVTGYALVDLAALMGDYD